MAEVRRELPFPDRPNDPLACPGMAPKGRPRRFHAVRERRESAHLTHSQPHQRKVSCPNPQRTHGLDNGKT